MAETKKKQLTLAQENNEIAKIFKRIKAIAESYLDQGYPAAPDPIQHLELIEEQVKKYDIQFGNQEVFKVVGRLNPYWNEQLGRMMLFYKHPLFDLKAVKIEPATAEISVVEKTKEEIYREAVEHEESLKQARRKEAEGK